METFEIDHLSEDLVMSQGSPEIKGWITDRRREITQERLRGNNPVKNNNNSGSTRGDQCRRGSVRSWSLLVSA